MADTTPKKNIFVVFFTWLWSVVLWTWNLIWTVAKQGWSLVSDHQWDFDPFKLAGFASFAFAAFIAFQVIDLAKAAAPNPTALTVLAGLVASFITVGTFLFSQARKQDEVQAKLTQDPGPGNGGK